MIIGCGGKDADSSRDTGIVQLKFLKATISELAGERFGVNKKNRPERTEGSLRMRWWSSGARPAR